MCKIWTCTKYSTLLTYALQVRDAEKLSAKTAHILSIITHLSQVCRFVTAVTAALSRYGELPVRANQVFVFFGMTDSLSVAMCGAGLMFECVHMHTCMLTERSTNAHTHTHTHAHTRTHTRCWMQCA